MKKYSKIILLSLLFIPLQLQAQYGFVEFKRYGEIYLKEGRYQEAINLLNFYISANPKSADGYYLRGLSYEQIKQYNHSVMDLSQAESLNSDDQDIGNDLDRVVRKLYEGLSGNNKTILNDSIVNTDRELIRFGLIDKLILAKQYEYSYSLLRLFLRNYSDTDKYKELNLIVNELRDSVYNNEVNQLTELLKSDPANKETVLQLASLYSDHNVLDSAIEVLWEYLQTV
ncbi:MAG: hypothetical protein WC061_09350, partial [Melioribacteraceae bacterium]